jgi:hypothetical protein
MTKENHSSKQEGEVKDLKKKVDNLQKMLDMTIEHDSKMAQRPKGHSYPERFGKYEMT